MKRGSCLLAVVVLLVGGCASTPKNKRPETMEVKVIKASETKYQNAKRVQPKKKAKKSGFLWFQKKKAKVLEKKVVTATKG